jgi:hypothetical protein
MSMSGISMYQEMQTEITIPAASSGSEHAPYSKVIIRRALYWLHYWRLKLEGLTERRNKLLTNGLCLRGLQSFCLFHGSLVGEAEGSRSCARIDHFSC